MTSVSALANNVAVWNSQAAITNTNYAKAKLASLQASVKPKQQQLQTYKANIERLQQQYNSQQSNLTDARSKIWPTKSRPICKAMTKLLSKFKQR